jgi:hypothetical protein
MILLESMDCPYCSSIANGKYGVVDVHTALYECKKCGWWELVRVIVNKEVESLFGFSWCGINKGILKRYPINSLEVPMEELRKYLKNHPSDMAYTNTTAFEKLMAHCIRETNDYCEVKHVGGTGDGGVDIELVSLNEGKRLVQVKRREDITSTEGVKVVRELNGVLLRENNYKGMVITTAKKFSGEVLDEINKTKQSREEYDMKLFTYKDIVELFDVKPSNPYRPWENFLKPFNKQQL